MKTKHPVQKHTKSIAKNQWLSVVQSLEELMEQRASTETPQTKQSLMDKTALDAVNRAYTVTLRYYTILLGGGKQDALAQRQISHLWQQAGTRMRKYDADIAANLRASEHFWSNEITWQNDTIQKAWPHLNAIRVCANRMDPALRSPFSMS